MNEDEYVGPGMESSPDDTMASNSGAPPNAVNPDRDLTNAVGVINRKVDELARIISQMAQMLMMHDQVLQQLMGTSDTGGKPEPVPPAGGPPPPPSQATPPV